MMLTGIIRESYAQESKTSDRIFELPANKVHRKFIIELGRNDKMQIELTELEGLSHVKNVDSLVALLIRDLEPLKDSLTETGLFNRRIDYVLDTTVNKKIRVQRFYPSSSHFVVRDGEASLLKLEQDTITITGKIYKKIRSGVFGYYPDYSYYRVSFFLNSQHDILLYVDGKLNAKVRTLIENVNRQWVYKGNNYPYLEKDPDIKAPAFRGLVGHSETLALRLSVNIQNYKNEFVPSASAGIALVKNTNLVKKRYGFTAENHFRFAKTSGKNAETFLNSFLTLSYWEESVIDEDSKGVRKLNPAVSLGYLVRRRGDFYEKNTFKLGLGQFSPFGGNTKIEPTFYFNNFFKDFTPSLRLTQYF